jgi:hypothetical protein
LHPFAGEWVTFTLAQRLGWGSFVMGLALAIFLLRELQKTWKPEYGLFALVTVGAFSVMYMTSIVRPEASSILLTAAGPFHNWRYSFIPGNLAVLIVFATTQGFKLGFRRPWAVSLLTATILALHTLTQFHIPRFGIHYGWYRRSSAPLAAALKEECPNRVVIPINPSGWSFIVDKAVHNPTCAKR